MFKKIVSQLSFSPTTVGELSDFAARLKKRQAFLGTGFALACALLIFQSIILLFPAQSQQTRNPAALVSGGLPTHSSITSAYDTNYQEFQSILQHLSIDSSALESAIQINVPTLNSSYRYISRAPLGVTSVRFDNESPVSLYITPSGSVSLNNTDLGWKGTTEDGSTFILYQNAVLAVDDPTLISPDPSTHLEITPTLSPSGSLSTSELLSLTLLVENVTSQHISDIVVLSTYDLDEYATITSADDNGIVSSQNNEIIWPSISLAPGESITLTAAAITHSSFDSSTSSSLGTAGDCAISIFINGKASQTPVTCSLQKSIDLILVRSLFQPSMKILFVATAVIALVLLVLFLSTRLQSKELRIIRKQLNSGELL